MFKFLKEKLGNVVKKFSKEVEEEAEQIEDKKETPQEEKKETAKVIEKKSVKKEKPEPEEETSIEKEPDKEELEPKKEEKSEESESEPEEIEIEIPEKDTTKKDHTTKKEEPAPKESVKEPDKESEEKEPEEKKEPEKKKESFFSKIFHKKKEEIKEEKKEELPQDEEELAEELEKEEHKESEKKKDDVKTLEPKKKEFFQKPEETPEEKEIQEKELEELEEAPQEEKQKESEEKITKEKEELESLKESPKKLEEKTELKPEVKEEKKGFFKKVSESFTKINLSEQKFEELFWDIEVTLLENNVAVEVIELIKKDLKEELTTDKVSRKNVEQIILDTLKLSLDKVLTVPEINLEKEIEKKKPYIIAVIGVNGSGKTTAIAKLTYYLKKQNYSVVLAAADTFRAAAIQQIEEHANKLDVKLIKHDYNSDPAAVAFDAVKHAEAKKIDVVLIDTAGRMHSNDNLMNELKKLIRVNKPDLKIFVGESITGNDCVEQARTYNAEIGIDAIILTKADIDEKGGAAISISHVTQKPILFIGTGQKYDDLEKFNKKKILESLGL